MDIELEQPDTATGAFIAMRDKLAGLTLAVDSMAGAWKALFIPDYSETLEKMTATLGSIGKTLDELAEMPALKMGPEELSAAIIKAGKDARAEDRESLHAAIKTFNHNAEEMAARTRSALKAEEQDKWLWRAAGAGALAGAMLAILVPLVATTLAPDSWHWPEKRAASIVGGDMWNTGERLQASADYKRWAVRSDFERMTEDSRERIATCVRAAAKVQTPTRCDVVLKPPKPGGR